jgi:hypothetical protein
MQANNRLPDNQTFNSYPEHKAGIPHINLVPGSRNMRAITVLPRSLSFSAQEADEVIYILARRHIITNLSWILRSILAAVFPPLAIASVSFLSHFFTGAGFFNDTFYRVIPFSLVIMLLAFYYSVIITLAFADFLNWVYNVYIVTNERIIHISFKALTGSSFSEAELKNVIDISEHKYGLIPGIFDYGDIVLQTAARSGSFNLHQVPDPEWFVSVITDLKEDAEEGIIRGREV